MTEKNKGGRPTIFTQELADIICKRIAAGESLRRICFEPEMPNADTVFTWLIDDKHKRFSENFSRARASQAELMFDEILDIADDGENDYMTITKGDTSYNMEDKEVTNRSKLRVETRKWYLSKVLPKKFGDKMDVTSGGRPIPLLNVIRNNDGNAENSGAHEAH